MVYKLPEKLNGRLRSKLFQRWHVHVINKEDTLLSHRRPKHPLPSLV